MSSRAHTLRNTLFSTVGLYTEFALGMLVSIVIARHLGPQTFGAYSGVIWLMAMGVAIAALVGLCLGIAAGIIPLFGAPLSPLLTVLSMVPPLAALPMKSCR